MNVGNFVLHIFDFIPPHGKYEGHWLYYQKLVKIIGKCPVLSDRCVIIRSEGQEYHCPISNLRCADEYSYLELTYDMPP
jgi:hypothetical protein